MPFESHHASVFIAREAADVYAYAADPAHLPEWAAGLAGSIELIDGRWVADLAMGRRRCGASSSPELSRTDASPRPPRE